MAVDTETTGLSPWHDDKIFAVGACCYDARGELAQWYWEWPVDPKTREVCYRREDVELLAALLSSPETRYVFHNSKFDLHMLAKLGREVLGTPLEVAGAIEDTSFMARICSTDEMLYRLKYLSKKYLRSAHPLCDDDDEKALEDAVVAIRRRAGRQGWKTHKDKEADYWLVQHNDKVNLPALTKDGREVKSLVREYCLRDVYRTWWLHQFYAELMDQEPQIYARKETQQVTRTTFSGTKQFQTTKKVVAPGDSTWRRFYEREKELLPVVMAMEERGMHISRKKAQEHLKLAVGRLAEQLNLLRQMSQCSELNPGSSLQIARLLFSSPEEGGFGLTPKAFGRSIDKKTGKRVASVNYEALREYMEEPFVRELLQYRNADKAVNTFFQKYCDLMLPDHLTPLAGPDHYVVHTSLNQCGTTTGRFSSNDPNLQQISNPGSSRKGSNIRGREPFGPRPGYYWFCCDYAKQESVVFADCAQVPGMLEIINRGEDINNYLTNKAWGGRGNKAALQAAADALELSAADPTSEKIQALWDEYGWCVSDSHQYGARSEHAYEFADWWLAQHNYEIVAAESSIDKGVSRARGKTVFFAEIYGGGPGSVVDLLYCTYSEAKAFMQALEAPFPEIRQYMNRMQAKARKDGYVINRYGRRLMVNPQFAYKIVNYMVQGTCADMMKSAIMRVHHLFRTSGIDAHVLMTIHDELIVEVRIEDADEELLLAIKEIMEDTEGALTVPMTVEISRCTESWEAKEKLKL